ncbi:MAG: RNA polymerase sigma factor [Gemmatimonadales bacterium]
MSGLRAVALLPEHVFADDRQQPNAASAEREAADGALVERLRRGDADALETLVQRYWSSLLGYAVRIIGSVDAAEDVAQETFCRLWDHRDRWNPTESVRGLLFRIARNLSISSRRRGMVHNRVTAVLALEPSVPATPLDAVEADDLAGMLNRAIETLPARRREVFVLRCVHGLSYREVAEVMGISQQTVANQLSHALASLRTILAGRLDA